MQIKINNQKFEVEAEPATPLLWVLREELKMTGTKFGCGKGLCGACTVLIDGKAVRSCSFPVAAVAAAHVTTIEGLADGEKLHPVQQAWMDHDVIQCGYCQGGQILSAVSLLNEKKHPNDKEIATAMSGNICRCGTYNRICKAIKAVSSEKS